MDRNLFRQRVLAYWLLSPLVTIPAGLGSLSLLTALVLRDAAGFLGFLGVSGILFGVGMAVTRWVLSADQFSQAAFAELQGESERTKSAYLDELAKRLSGDNDPRIRANLDKLRRLSERLERLKLNPTDPSSEMLPEIRDKADDLLTSCLKSLERAWQQGRVAQEMATEQGRNEILQSRSQLLDEVTTSVDHLGATLDHLQVVSLKRDSESTNPASVRRELEMGLEVARRVEQRMDQFEDNLRSAPDATRSENPAPGA